MKNSLLATLSLCFLLFASISLAAKPQEYKIQIKNHKFIPDSLIVPSGTRVILLIENLDSTIEEFESHDLNREKLISGGRTVKIPVGPLKKGTYNFFGEFNPKTAQGNLIVE